MPGEVRSFIDGGCAIGVILREVGFWSSLINLEFAAAFIVSIVTNPSRAAFPCRNLH
ncbi:MAG: hypothetical protein QOH31_2083 [Verrucomicrobiota bacterium]|jgi:hypothetical protein